MIIVSYSPYPSSNKTKNKCFSCGEKKQEAFLLTRTNDNNTTYMGFWSCDACQGAIKTEVQDFINQDKHVLPGITAHKNARHYDYDDKNYLLNCHFKPLSRPRARSRRT
jgi:hypothetical protein